METIDAREVYIEFVEMLAPENYKRFQWNQMCVIKITNKLKRSVGTQFLALLHYSSYGTQQPIQNNFNYARNVPKERFLN